MKFAENRTEKSHLADGGEPMKDNHDNDNTERHLAAHCVVPIFVVYTLSWLISTQQS